MSAQTEYFTCLVKENTRPKDDYVNATNWSKAFGKEWKNYKKSARCKKLIQVLVVDLEVTICHLMETRLGKDSETWVHPEIAIDFAQWLSPEFSSFVKRIFIRYLKGDRTLAAEILERDHNRDHVERAKNRLHCSDTDKTTAQIAFAAKKPIAQVHNDRYYGLYDKSEAELRKDADIQPSQTPLDAMSPINLGSIGIPGR